MRKEARAAKKRVGIAADPLIAQNYKQRLEAKSYYAAEADAS